MTTASPPSASLLQLALRGGGAFREVSELLRGVTHAEATRPVPGLPHTLGDVLRHLALTQRASLDLAAGRADAWPGELDVWPAAPLTEDGLRRVLTDLHFGVTEAEMLAGGPSARAREVLTDLAAHNAYHWGQVALIRRLHGTLPLGAPDERRAE